MTERLRELTDIDDPALAELAQLVRAMSDLDPPLGVQERVRRALAEPRPDRRRPSPFVLAAVLLVVVLPAAIAGVRKLATLVPAPPAPVVQPIDEDDAKPAPGRRRATLRASRPSVPDDVPADPPTDEPASDPVAAPEPPPAPIAGPAPAPVAGPAPAPIAGPAPAPVDPPAPPVPSEPRAPSRPRAPSGSPAPGGSPAPSAVPGSPAPCAPSGPPAPSGPASTAGPVSRLPAVPPTPQSEAALVIGALHLLHHDHDARGALFQLDTYRTQFPYGDLAEEALSLSIEAHWTLGDSAAAALADLYLRQFPQGRFRALAEGARRQFSAR